MITKRRIVNIVVLLLVGLVAFGQETQQASSQSGKQDSVGLVAYYNGLYSSPESDQAIDNIAATGAKWVNILVTQYQFTTSSTSIYPTEKTPTDDDLIHIINKAKSVGLKVTLKPHIDIQSDESQWRGRIGQNFNDGTWASWFSSYKNFIGHYADLSEQHGVEQLVIGTELVIASQREAEWRDVASHVRGRYNGLITYSANHSGEEVNVQWWDAVDYIGVSAYYDLTDKTNPSVSEIKAAWQRHINTLADLSQQWNKKVVFTEIGYRSSDGNNTHPWCHYCTGEGLDLQEQADSYRAFYEAVYNQPWLEGVHWWGWDLDAEDNGVCDDGYSPHLKPAENVIRQYYGGSSITIPTTCNAVAPTSTPGSSQPTNTPTNTPVPPANTPTDVPPQNTPVPPTSTPVPPANTPVPPTNTSVPPQPPAQCGGLRHEGEAGQFTGSAFSVGSSSAASGGQYVEALNTNSDGTFNANSSALYCATVPESGMYGIRARAAADSSVSDSLYVYVDGAPASGWVWHLWATGAFETTDLYVAEGNSPTLNMLSISLTAGEHTIAFAGRESGPRLDWFELIPLSSAPPVEPTPTTIPPTTVPPTTVPTNTPPPPAATQPPATQVAPTNTPVPPSATSVPTSTAVPPTPTQQPPSTTCGPLDQEGEAGDITGNLFTIGTDASASGGQYVHIANGSGNRGSSPDDSQKVTFCMQVDVAGTYRLNGWTYGASGYDNSFYVRVNGSPAAGIVWHTPINQTYLGEPVVQHDVANNQFGVVEFELSAGPQIIEFLMREDGVRLDRIALQRVGSAGLQASDAEVAGADLSRLQNDISFGPSETENKVFLPLMGQ